MSLTLSCDSHANSSVTFHCRWNSLWESTHSHDDCLCVLVLCVIVPYNRAQLMIKVWMLYNCVCIHKQNTELHYCLLNIILIISEDEKSVRRHHELVKYTIWVRSCLTCCRRRSNFDNGLNKVEGVVW